MSTTQPRDRWMRGDAYDAYVGRWSRMVARQFIAWLAVSPGARWLDVGCGTGALTSVILELATPREVIGIDPSVGFLETARDRIADARVRFEPGDARELPIQAGTIEVAVAGLSLNFVPEPAVAIGEMARVVVPGGDVGAYVWDYTERMEMMQYFWDSAGTVDPAARDANEGARFASFCHPDALASRFAGAGLVDVQVRAIEIATAFTSFDDYWQPFLGGQGSAPSYLATLSEDRRTAIREVVRAALPIAADGSISLMARAWAVRGTARPNTARSL